ncbi:MAG: crossover junction endodeoxyribonuclease RuvC [Bacteroidota bacterium]|nr:crossover junction endodeoxyribonuclease RuvC [Bacteroidota bacterium]
MQTPDKIILGIDPGTVIMGYSVIEVINNIITVKDINVLKLPAKKDNYERLQLIHQRVTALVNLHHPKELAIEAPFFGKNVQSMLKLGRAQGVAIAAAMNFGIPVTEYSPKKIKQSITGNGNANKEQIWKMLLNLVSLENKPHYFDATDALAVAICHHFSSRSPLKKTVSKKKTASTWERFAFENPGRLL